MATIKNVAKLAGVSVATVSRVINNDPAVAEKSKEKVNSAISELNYNPNRLARMFRRSESKLILVLIPTMENRFFYSGSGLFKGIEDAASAHHYSLMISCTYFDSKKEKEYINLLKTRAVDGVISISSEMNASEMTDLAKEYPIVQCSGYLENSKTDVVAINDEQASYDAVNYLISQGHRRVAYIGSSNSYTVGQKRKEGYLHALRDNGIEPDKNLMQYSEYTFQGGKLAMRYLRLQNTEFSALFAVSDAMAIGAMNEMNERGISNIAVMGFDNTAFSGFSNPTLSSVSQHAYEMGETAMQLLHFRIQDMTRECSFVTVPHELVLRDSTKVTDKDQAV